MQKIAIIYLSYNPRPYLDRVINALKRMSYPKDKVEFIVVDNPHPQFGSAGDFLKEKLMPLSGNDLPKVVIIENQEKLRGKVILDCCNVIHMDGEKIYHI